MAYNQQRSNSSNQHNYNLDLNQLRTSSNPQNLPQENFQIEQGRQQQQRNSPSGFQNFGQDDKNSVANAQRLNQFSNAAPLYMTGDLPLSQDQFLQSRFTPTQFPSYASPSSSAISFNNNNLSRTGDQTGRIPFQSTSSNTFEPIENATPAHTATFRSHSASISLSEPTKSPAAMSPFMISGSGGANSTVASENNYSGNGESGDLNDSQVQMLLQQPLKISSVEVAAFYAREMSRTASGSTIFPTGSVQSQEQMSFQPEQEQALPQQQLPSSNRNTFQLPAQRQINYNTDDQRKGSPFSGPAGGSATGMPLTFANQIYDFSSSQEQSQQLQRMDNRPGMNQSFARPQYPFVGSLPNYPKTSSNSTASSSNSNMYRGITHRRVPAACNFCRMRKLRCDGNTPCRQCARRMIQCIYSEAAETRRQRRATVSTYPNSPATSTTMSSMSMAQFNNERSIQAQGSSFSTYSGILQPDQRQNWTANDQVTASRVGPSNQQMQSHQFQQINFAEQQYRFSQPQVQPNAGIITQQDTNAQGNDSNVKSSSQIAGLPANWMPVSLHAPHRTALPGGSSNSIQNADQSNVQQKLSPYSMPTTNDLSIPSPDQRNLHQDPDQKSYRPFQSRKK